MSEKKNKPTPKAVLFTTPLLLAAVCISITAVVGITPYNKFETYLNIAFSDNIKSQTSAAESIVISETIDLFERNEDEKVSSTGEVKYPSFGEQYAMLSCEAIGLNVPVYWGTSTELLKNGACQPSSSAAAGDKGNTVIDAHVNTFFADLDKLAEGDIVKINTSYGEFTYKVTGQAVFEKTSKKYISQGKTDKLTLYTCVKQILGSSSQRLAVICEPLEKNFYN